MTAPRPVPAGVPAPGVLADDPAQALLAARAAELARPLEQQQDDDRVALLVLVLGEQRVAVRVDGLREVHPPLRLARVPGGNGVLVGVVAGRHGALPVATLAGLLGTTGARPVDEQWVAVLDDPVAPVGLLVDAADDVVVVRAGELSPAPDAGGLVAALAPGGLLVLDAAAVRRDPRLFLSPPDQNEEPSWHDA